MIYKMKLVLLVVVGVAIFACKQTKEKAEIVEVEEVDLINDEFPEAKKEILETWNAIEQSLRDGDMDKLISFHAYGPKFTEFKNGEPRNDSKENEEFERNTFSQVTEVIKFDANDMHIAVFGDVANVTMHTDFQLKFGENLVVVNDQMSLLFAKTNAGWKIVSEHHSPLLKNES